MLKIPKRRLLFSRCNPGSWRRILSEDWSDRVVPPFDNIVTTAYHLRALRIRDAILVSKAWRDGAAPKDVVTAAALTQRHSSGSGNSTHGCLDDADMMRYTCPSLGPRSMKGFKMFRIGDCQSFFAQILLHINSITVTIFFCIS